MEFSFRRGEKRYNFNSEAGVSIAIPLRFNDKQPDAHGLSPAQLEPSEAAGTVFDTRQGGSCNAENLSFAPHSCGTHTECVGHITHERISMADSLEQSLFCASLVSIEPTPAASCKEDYDPSPKQSDLIISEQALRSSLSNSDSDFLQALIVRTLPNQEDKQWRNYCSKPSPFFSLGAMQYIVSLGVKHLLVDMPSIDSLSDQGKLRNHRIFWGMEPGSFETPSYNERLKTITEMIFVPNHLTDGIYLLELKTPRFVCNAAPSSPYLYEVK